MMEDTLASRYSSQNHVPRQREALMSSNVTRRDFIRLATGFLAYLPRIAGVPGAFLLATAPTAVQARELDLSEGEYDPAHVVLIDPDELGFQVLDVVSGLAIPDAHVVVTSYAEGARVQTVDGYTDASGVWVSNVVDLCEPDGLARPIKSYEFYARIDISKDGYRPFTTALVRRASSCQITYIRFSSDFYVRASTCSYRKVK